MRACTWTCWRSASPEYLARAGTPATPQQLPAHQWLAFGRDVTVGVPKEGLTAAAHESARSLSKGAASTSQPVAMTLDAHAATGERQRVHVQARIASNNQISLQQMCEHGLGIAHLGHADAAPALARGELVRLLPQWRLGSMPVWVVTPRRDEAEAAKVREAVEHLRGHFGTLQARARGDAMAG